MNTLLSLFPWRAAKSLLEWHGNRLLIERDRWETVHLMGVRSNTDGQPVWSQVDPTFGQVPADATHIKLGKVVWIDKSIWFWTD